MITRASPREAEAQEVYILPALEHPRRKALRILVLPDGNKRSDPREGGYARGAQKVVEIAEHLARRPDVAVMVACVLSPENIAARSDAFFAHLRDGFLRLAARIDERRTLIAAGVRAELCGDLRALRARRGNAAALADAIEAVIARTSVVSTPSLRLLFGVGYRSTTPRDLDIDLVLRTGLEEDAAFRLSGLSSHPSIANYAMTKLWPEITTDDVDVILEATKQRRATGFAKGYEPDAIVDLVRVLARAPLERPVRATLATHVSRPAMTEAIERHYADASSLDAGVAVICAGDTITVHGPTRGARHAIRVLCDGQRSPATEDGAYASMLAPGQQQPLLVLPEGHYGYATIHPCEATPAGIVKGLEAATRFSATHVALRGAERDLDNAHAVRRADLPSPAAGFVNEGATK
ncbi:Hypothetical protein A7982_01271 [Minicystis rosea]|nr:Hypothetical protein A7982_01271 [Minicystis rosea]